MEILSERSSRVVAYTKLHRAAVRRDKGRFLVEGANAVSAAVASGRAVTVLIRDGDAEGHSALVGRATGADVPVVGLTARACAKLAETTTPPGIFAVCELLDTGLSEVLGRSVDLIAVAVEPREPGNAGTLIRCADAMGADAVILLGDAVDPHNGKCVRSSAGSIFHMPIVRERDVAGALDALRGAGVTVLATTADGEVCIDDADELLRRPTAWLFGNEAHGLPDAVVAEADHRVSIPLRGRAESLNLAAAAAICLYASARVRPRP